MQNIFTTAPSSKDMLKLLSIFPQSTQVWTFWWYKRRIFSFCSEKNSLLVQSSESCFDNNLYVLQKSWHFSHFLALTNKFQARAFHICWEYPWLFQDWNRSENKKLNAFFYDWKLRLSIVEQKKKSPHEKFEIWSSWSEFWFPAVVLCPFHWFTFTTVNFRSLRRAPSFSSRPWFPPFIVMWKLGDSVSGISLYSGAPMRTANTRRKAVKERRKAKD